VNRLLWLIWVALVATVPSPAAGQEAAAERITLGTAQRFHAKMETIMERSGFDCSMDGFPEWQWGFGVRPTAGRLGEWVFIGGKRDGDTGHLSGLAQQVLRVQLLPKGKAAGDAKLSEFEGYDVAIKAVSQYEGRIIGEGKFGLRTSTQALIALLRETPGEQADVLAAASSGLMKHVRGERNVPRTFFLSLDRKDPPREFLARFSSMRPEVRPSSEFGKDRDDIRINLDTTEVYWHDAERVDVRYGYDLVPESLWWSGYCRVEKRGNQWTSTDIELKKGWKSKSSNWYSSENP
jgi:hypothetical protein